MRRSRATSKKEKKGHIWRKRLSARPCAGHALSNVRCKVTVATRSSTTLKVNGYLFIYLDKVDPYLPQRCTRGYSEISTIYKNNNNNNSSSSSTTEKNNRQCTTVILDIFINFFLSF